MRNRVTVSLTGGMGNQLFQWAAGFSLSKRLSLRLDIVPDRISLDEPRLHEREYELRYFSIVPKRNRWMAGKALGAMKTRLGGEPCTFTEASFRYDPNFEAVSRGTLLRGYFQSYKYFAPHAVDVRQQLLVGASPSPAARALAADLRGKRWIGVHVRRGDYLNFPEIFPIAGAEFYRAALASLGSKDFDEIVVFSERRADGVEAVPEATRYVDSSLIAQPGDVIMLLADSTHVVGANSSLSWWGAFLNPRQEARRVFPAKWFGPQGWDASDIVPPSWEKL